MIERLRRPFGRDSLLEAAAILFEKTVPFARIFSRNKATQLLGPGVAASAGSFRSLRLNFRHR